MENKVYFVELTEEQKKFLEKYKPEEDMFTSKEEMETITSLFCLKERDRKDLIGLRNSVVDFYREKINKAINEHGGHCQESWDLSTSMQSVSAVIDYYKINMGIAV